MGSRHLRFVHVVDLVELLFNGFASFLGEDWYTRGYIRLEIFRHKSDKPDQMSECSV